MIFTTWKFGPDESEWRNLPKTGWRTTLKHMALHGDQGREAARQYAADIFNVCAAKRDYPYADHAWPAIPWPLPFVAAVEIKQNVLREFNRSNPGREITSSSAF